MDQIAVATWGLAGVTLLLVVVSVLQFLSIRSQAARADERDGKGMQVLRRQVIVLKRQADALVASARASQAMADEMLEARRSANPLRLRVELQEPRVSGSLAAFLCNDGDRAEVILRSEILLGSDVVEPTNWGNLYLEPQGRHPLVSLFAVGRGDLLTLRVTGRPKDGIEQTREFLFRIKPDGTLEDLDQPQPPPMVAFR